MAAKSAFWWYKATYGGKEKVLQSLIEGFLNQGAQGELVARCKAAKSAFG
jgi:hypothetical protein